MIPVLAGILCVTIWIYILTARRTSWRSTPAPDPETFPAVVAVIPARNEEATIADAVRSLARQDYRGDFHIIVVDDDSEDATARLALEAAPPHRLTVLRAAPLPPEWTGKLWAMAEGARHVPSEPEYILFTDADIVHPPDCVSGLVARSHSGGYDLVSYMAALRCRTLAERTLVPAFVFFFFLLYPPRWIADPRRKSAGAAGGCILLRRSALERCGGIQSIRSALIDDCALAAAVKRTGGRVWLGLHPEVRSIRDYRTFAEVERMISRTAFTQLRHSLTLLIGTLLAMALVFFVPPGLALGAALPARGLGILAWLLMSAAYVPPLRYFQRSPLWAPLLPLVAAFYAGSTLHSAVSHWRGGGGLWKGRVQG